MSYQEALALIHLLTGATALGSLSFMLGMLASKKIPEAAGGVIVTALYIGTVAALIWILTF